LKLYCEFEKIYGGVNITKIIDTQHLEYTNANKQNYEIVKSAFTEE
jgi:hypothetical protein